MRVEIGLSVPCDPRNRAVPENDINYDSSGRSAPALAK